MALNGCEDRIDWPQPWRPAGMASAETLARAPSAARRVVVVIVCSSVVNFGSATSGDSMSIASQARISSVARPQSATCSTQAIAPAFVVGRVASRARGRHFPPLSDAALISAANRVAEKVAASMEGEAWDDNVAPVQSGRFH